MLYLGMEALHPNSDRGTMSVVRSPVRAPYNSTAPASPSPTPTPVTKLDSSRVLRDRPLPSDAGTLLPESPRLVGAVVMGRLTALLLVCDGKGINSE